MITRSAFTPDKEYLILKELKTYGQICGILIRPALGSSVASFGSVVLMRDHTY